MDTEHSSHITHFLVHSDFFCIVTHSIMGSTPKLYAHADYLNLFLGRVVYYLYPLISKVKIAIILLVSFVTSATYAFPKLVSVYTTHRVWKQIVHRAEVAKTRGETALIIHSTDLPLYPVTLHHLPIPNTVMRKTLNVEVPLYPIKWEQYKGWEDKWIIPETYALELPQIHANKKIASRLGLDAIFYIVD